MAALAARRAGDVAAEQRHRAGVGRDLAGDEIEQGGLAGAVRSDDQTAFAGGDVKTDIGGDAQAAERLAQIADGKRGRGHGFGPVADAAVLPAVLFCRFAACHAERVSRTAPGTSPSGMNTTMATKMAPSMKFQRVI